MKAFNITIGENGRMIIPATIRKKLKIEAGDKVILKLSEDNDIIVHTPKQSLKKLQTLLKDTKGSLVDDLIKMRREEEI